MVQGSGNGTLSAPLSPVHVPVVVQNENNHPPLALDNNNDDSDDEVQALNARLKSDVWDDFSRLRVGNEIKAKCKHCLKLLGGGAKCGTSHLRHHQKRCFKKKIHERKQAVFGSNYLAKGKKELAVCTFNSDVSKKELAIALVMHEYPLSIVDHLYFRRFVCSLQPLFSIPTRNTLKKEIFKMYECERGRIAITTDMWTASTQKKGYMAVTAHYIDNSWKLRSHMLRFMYVPSPHKAERLAKILLETMMDWNIDTKVSSITLDNCSTNDRMIAEVKQMIVPAHLIKDGALLHMRCAAHILNLVVKDGLNVVKEGIEKVRDSVLWWTATPKRVEFFQETAKQLRISTDRCLVLDCPTRWNSTYSMLVTAIPYRDVFARLRQRDAKYSITFSNSDWEFAIMVCEKLKIFNSITELFSGTTYPTANLFFPKICELKLKIAEWLIDPNTTVSGMAALMWDKFIKYWDSIHEILALAVVLDPRYKLDVIDYYCGKFGLVGLASSFSSDKIQQLMYDLIDEYQRKNSASTGLADSEAKSNSSSDDMDFEIFLSQRKKAKTSSYKSELDHYLSEDIIPRTSDFDILLWWKQNCPKYPTLGDIAKDLLAIPVSSVASESAFSSGGRLLDPHRSKLHYSTVEALMCTRTWIQDEFRRGKLQSLCSCNLVSLI
ncbi:Putative AC transposase [Linum grandiflorum]